jgi:hypothetical protein
MCNGSNTTTTGIGILPKRNTPFLVGMYPIMKLKCKKCKFEEDIYLGGGKK